jgi:hypothetical protein
MIPNHSQLINLMVGADLGFVAGRCATEFSDSPGPTDEDLADLETLKSGAT